MNLENYYLKENIKMEKKMVKEKNIMNMIHYYTKVNIQMVKEEEME